MKPPISPWTQAVCLVRCANLSLGASGTTVSGRFCAAQPLPHTSRQVFRSTAAVVGVEPAVAEHSRVLSRWRGDDSKEVRLFGIGGSVRILGSWGPCRPFFRCDTCWHLFPARPKRRQKPPKNRAKTVRNKQPAYSAIRWQLFYNGRVAPSSVSPTRSIRPPIAFSRTSARFTPLADLYSTKTLR